MAPDIPHELQSLFVPQFEQLGATLHTDGACCTMRTDSPVAHGRACAVAAGPWCLVMDYAFIARQTMRFVESPICAYAGFCIASEAMLPQMDAATYRPIGQLPQGHLFSFRERAGSRHAQLFEGSLYRARCICLLPEFFDDLERRWHGEFAGLFDALGSPCGAQTAQAALRILPHLQPQPGTESALALHGYAELLASELAACIHPRAAGDDSVVTLAAEGAVPAPDSGAAGQAVGDGTAGVCAAGPDAIALIERLDAYVRAHLDEPLTIDRLAQALFVSRSTLCAAAQAADGMGVATRIRALRLARARNLLRDRRLTVEEVARRVGYPRATSFTAAFTRAYGLPPSAWRRSE